MTEDIRSGETLTIHYQLIDVARELIQSADRWEKAGAPESLVFARARCVAAIILACAALEGCANAIAGLHYASPRGSRDAQETEWCSAGDRNPWHWKHVCRKWQDMAQLVPDGHLSSVWEQLRRTLGVTIPVDDLCPQTGGWHGVLVSLFKLRDEAGVHFKGAWGPPGAEDSYSAMGVTLASYCISFARAMINGLCRGYEAKYGVVIRYSLTPQVASGLAAKDDGSVPGIPPIGTAGTARVVQDIGPGEGSR